MSTAILIFSMDMMKFLCVCDKLKYIMIAIVDTIYVLIKLCHKVL